jgi:hypothetical protein
VPVAGGISDEVADWAELTETQVEALRLYAPPVRGYGPRLALELRGRCAACRVRSVAVRHEPRETRRGLTLEALAESGLVYLRAEYQRPEAEVERLQSQ